MQFSIDFSLKLTLDGGKLTKLKQLTMQSNFHKKTLRNLALELRIYKAVILELLKYL